MMPLGEANPRPVVREEDYKRFLRFPPARPFEGPMATNADWARAWYEENGRPWWHGRRIEDFAAMPDGVRLRDQTFVSSTLAERAARASAALVVAVSAGPEVDDEAARRWAEDEPDRYFFVQAWGAAVVAVLLETARHEFAAQVGAELSQVRYGYAPGYPNWPIDDMPRLLALLRDDRDLPGPLEVLTSGMLKPQKSQLALFFAETRPPAA
jgi:hypothetical protein